MPRVTGFVYDTSSAAATGRTVRVYRRDTGALLGETTTSAGPAAAGDEHYNSTSLALLCNGSDGSTTVTDNSVSPKTVSVFGNAQIDTAQSAFGGASLLFDASGDYLTVPNSSAFDFGSGNLTFGFWARPASVAGIENLFRKNTGTNFSPFSFLFDAGRLRVRFSTSGTAYEVEYTGTIVLSTSAWTYCEIARDGDTIRSFVDGVADGTAAISGALAVTSTPMYIGALSTGAAGYGGHLDDIVITKGVARNVTGYSPPGAYVAALPVLAAGGYTLSYTGYSGEVQVVALDDSAGDVENDLIIRTTGV